MARRWTVLAATAILAATATVYLAMLLVTMPHLSAIAGAGGLADTRMFDMRPVGYDAETARALLIALGERGRDDYLHIQQRLDTAFPVLNGLSLFIGLSWVGSRLGLSRIAATLIAAALAIPAAGLDLAENHAVAVMLTTPPDSFDPELAASASRISVAKSVVVSTAMTLLVVGLSIVGWRALRRNHRRTGQ